MGTFDSKAAALTPRPVKELAWDNYLNIDDLTFDQQFLPEVYEKEIERFGNRTISGFLRMVGAEMPMASDVVTWAEQGRLHIAYDGLGTNLTNKNEITGLPANHLISVGMTIAVADDAGTTVDKAYVTTAAAGGTTIEVEVYGSAPAPAVDGELTIGANTDAKVFVYGSEYGKGTDNVGNTIEAKSDFFSNKPIILRDKYSVYGSNVAQIGWIEVTTEAGTGGYLWYLKSEHEARLRFQDYLEMSMVEAEKAIDNTGAETTITQTGFGGSGVISGSEGLFAAIESRGNVYSGLDLGSGAYVTSGGPSDTANSQYFVQNNGIADFDEILTQLDTQGAIEENMLFLDRSTALGFDNMLAALNAPYGGGTSYGVFENSEDMALNLGFNGFRRGSYDFYKTDWKYLNDSTTRGIVGDVEGVLVPAGVSTVYDQQLGTNIQRPFLHVRYRASEADDRRMKSWITGSVGGNYTSDEDAMNVHFLSERALCVQGANNFVLFKA
jgi:hypothetical protein